MYAFVFPRQSNSNSEGGTGATPDDSYEQSDDALLAHFQNAKRQLQPLRLDTIPETDSELSASISDASMASGIKPPYGIQVDENRLSTIKEQEGEIREDLLDDSKLLLSLELPTVHRFAEIENCCSPKAADSTGEQSTLTESGLLKGHSVQQKSSMSDDVDTSLEASGCDLLASPSMYNLRAHGKQAYIPHGGIGAAGENPRALRRRQRTGLEQIMKYSTPDLLLGTWLEELPPKPGFNFVPTKSYTAQDAIERLFNGTQVYKIGYNSLSVQTCIVQLSRGKDRLVFKRLANSGKETSFRVASMIGLVMGKTSGTFQLIEQSTTKSGIKAFEPWNCLSIICERQTIDMAAISQDALKDIWIGLSQLIHDSRKPPTTPKLSHAQFCIMSIQMKLTQDAQERQISFNEVVLLGIYRAMKTMTDITDSMRQRIVDRLAIRFQFSHKFMRVALMAARERVWIFQNTLREQSRRQRLNMINRIRKHALFVMKTHRIVKDSLGPTYRKRYRYLMKQITNCDWSKLAYNRLCELDSNLYLQSKVVLDHLSGKAAAKKLMSVSQDRRSSGAAKPRTGEVSWQLYESPVSSERNSDEAIPESEESDLLAQLGLNLSLGTRLEMHVGQWSSSEDEPDEPSF